VLDSGAVGPGSKSQSRRCRVTVCSHPLCLCSPSSEIGSSPLKGCEVNRGPGRKVLVAYRRVCDSRHLQADCREPGSAPEPYTLGNRVWATFTIWCVFAECEIVWTANLGYRFHLLGAAIQRAATTLEQCAMLCRQSTSCIVYQVRSVSPEPLRSIAWEQGCSGARTRGDGVPHFFRQGGRVPHPPLFGLKFVQKLVRCCNWLRTETQCKIISVKRVCRPKLF